MLPLVTKPERQNRTAPRVSALFFGGSIGKARERERGRVADADRYRYALILVRRRLLLLLLQSKSHRGRMRALTSYHTMTTLHPFATEDTQRRTQCVEYACFESALSSATVRGSECTSSAENSFFRFRLESSPSSFQAWASINSSHPTVSMA